MQVPYIIASVQNAEVPLWKEYSSSSVIQIVVALLSSCNVTGPLLTGAMLDRGETAVEPFMWLYKYLKQEIFADGDCRDFTDHQSRMGDSSGRGVDRILLRDLVCQCTVDYDVAVW